MDKETVDTCSAYGCLLIVGILSLGATVFIITVAIKLALTLF